MPNTDVETTHLQRGLISGHVDPYDFKSRHKISLKNHCTFKGCTFNDGIRFFSEGNEKLSLTLINCVFEKALHFGPQQKTAPTIKTVIDVFLESTSIRALEITQLCEIDVDMWGESTISNLFNFGILKIENSDEKLITIKEFNSSDITTISNIEIEKLTTNGGLLTLENCVINSIFANGGGLTSIGTEVSKELWANQIENLQIRDGKIASLSIIDSVLSKKTVIHSSIMNAEIGKLSFSNVRFVSVTPISNLIGTSSFIIKDTDLSSIHFFRCDFRKCSFEIHNANLGGIETDSINWPDNEFVEILQNKKKSKSAVQIEQEKRDYYRQLKIAAIKQHDKVNELKLYAFEMSSYYTFLTKTKGNYAEKFNLWVSRATNYFGLEWFPPIRIYIVTTFLTYTLIYFLHKGFATPCFLYMYQDLDLVRIFNPARSLENYETFQNLNVALAFLDYLLRIFQGLLIYQTISAFRKFFKS